jgi:hypothetical protein
VPACLDEFPCAANSGALWCDPKHWEYYREAVKRAILLLGKSGMES